jgi:hypothetical protein
VSADRVYDPGVIVGVDVIVGRPERLRAANVSDGPIASEAADRSTWHKAKPRGRTTMSDSPVDATYEQSRRDRTLSVPMEEVREGAVRSFNDASQSSSARCVQRAFVDDFARLRSDCRPCRSMSTGSRTALIQSRVTDER